MTPDLLIATNGFKGTWPSIEYGAWLASTLNTKITLLGVTEKLNPAVIDDHHPLEDVFERAVELFRQSGVTYNLEVQNGNAEEIVPRKVRQGNYITVIGAFRKAADSKVYCRAFHSLFDGGDRTADTICACIETSVK
jgi:hypothetical protein